MDHGNPEPSFLGVISHLFMVLGVQGEEESSPIFLAVYDRLMVQGVHPAPKIAKNKFPVSTEILGDFVPREFGYAQRIPKMYMLYFIYPLMYTIENQGIGTYYPTKFYLTKIN